MNRTAQIMLILGLSLSAQIAQAQWTPSQRLTWNSGDSQNPEIAVDSAGDLHVVWWDETPSDGPHIFYKKSEDGGDTWTTAKRISSNSTGSWGPAIAVDTSGNLHVVWEEFTPYLPYIYYARSTDGGATWSSAKTLCAGPGNCHNPDIAVDTLGGLHVVWRLNTTEYYEIYYRKSTDGGTTWSTIPRLTWSSDNSGAPAIAVDTSDNLHVVWYNFAPGTAEIYYKKSTDRGATWQAGKRLTWNSGESWAPQIAVDSSDNLHVVWYDFTPGTAELYYKRSTDGGTTWPTIKRLTWNSGDSESPAIFASALGNLRVVWSDKSPGNSEIYYKKSTLNGTSWFVDNRLTWNLGESKSPAITEDALGNLHVVWSENTPGNYEIYYKKFLK